MATKVAAVVAHPTATLQVMAVLLAAAVLAAEKTVVAALAFTALAIAAAAAITPEGNEKQRRG